MFIKFSSFGTLVIACTLTLSIAAPATIAGPTMVFSSTQIRGCSSPKKSQRSETHKHKKAEEEKAVAQSDSQQTNSVAEKSEAGQLETHLGFRQLKLHSVC